MALMALADSCWKITSDVAWALMPLILSVTGVVTVVAIAANEGAPSQAGAAKPVPICKLVGAVGASVKLASPISSICTGVVASAGIIFASANPQSPLVGFAADV